MPDPESHSPWDTTDYPNDGIGQIRFMKDRPAGMPLAEAKREWQARHPRPEPTVDPLLAAVRTHATRLRLELDRLDASASEYTGAGSQRITTAALVLREALDELDLRIDTEAAGQ